MLTRHFGNSVRAALVAPKVFINVEKKEKEKIHISSSGLFMFLRLCVGSHIRPGVILHLLILLWG